MGLFDGIKKLFSGAKLQETNLPVVSRGKPYYQNVTKPLFTQVLKVQLAGETEDTWDSFFSCIKTNEKLEGFDRRTGKKVRLHYYGTNSLVADHSSRIEIVSKSNLKRILLKDTPFEGMNVLEANANGAILGDKERIGFINFHSLEGMIYEFQWQPFSQALAKDYWLVGTRETYNGPGELYCFSFSGEHQWGIRFTEKMDTMFGTIEVTPYHLKVSSDSTDIFVSSMDRLYRINPDGSLAMRVAISELKETELQEKERKRQAKYSSKPKTEKEAIEMIANEMAQNFISGFTRLTFNSPFTAFAHDTSTDMVFILENEGRLTGWDKKGFLTWSVTFKEGGRYLKWLDENLVISLESGQTFWLNHRGEFAYAAKLSKQASTVLPIPGQEKELIVCEDNRLYELDKTTGELVAGMEGHPGMELFQIEDHNIFFDGKNSAMGYLWLGSAGQSWQIKRVQHVTNSAQGTDDLNSVAPEVKADKPFKLRWKYEDAKGYGIRLIDKQHKYFITLKRIDSQSKTGRLQDIVEILCFDFDLHVQWSKKVKTYPFSVHLAPDGETLFIGLGKGDGSDVAYDPGYLLMIDPKGKEIAKRKIPAIGFSIDFITDDRAIFMFRQENGTLLYEYSKDEKGVWQQGKQLKESLAKGEFGAGLNDLNLADYTIKRTDKKQYQITHGTKSEEIKLAAAIYEASEITNEKLVLRIGNKTIRCLGPDFLKEWELKTKHNITSLVPGENGVLLVSKEEIAFVDLDGAIKWRLSAPPNSYENQASWIKEKSVFLWAAGNEHNFVICSIKEEGKIENSQAFQDTRKYEAALFIEEAGMFLVHFPDFVECYSI
jgi:outer membrane protein assembly factor BamB